MPKTIQVPVQDLSLDLSNYRTVQQSSEIRAIQTMIKLRAEWFWALTRSLLDDGYLATENVLVLRKGKRGLIVKEGNRRVAALKIILGIVPVGKFEVPADILDQINNLSPAWKKANAKISCTVYESKDASKVDAIVRLIATAAFAGAKYAKMCYFTVDNFLIF